MKIVPFLLILTTFPLLAAETLQDAMKIYQAGDLAGAKAILESLAIQEPRNQTVQTYLKMISEKQARQLAAERQLEAIQVPKIDLKEASARESFDYLMQAINKNAPSGYRANLVWQVPSDYAGRVTLAMDNVPATVALKYTAESAGLKVAIEEFAIRVVKP